jgi:hypothetical protein
MLDLIIPAVCLVVIPAALALVGFVVGIVATNSLDLGP